MPKTNLKNDDDEFNAEKQFTFEKEMFLLQNYHHKVSFTVKGFFLLDETIYLTILASVTSYFIIVIQFEETYNQ